MFCIFFHQCGKVSRMIIELFCQVSNCNIFCIMNSDPLNDRFYIAGQMIVYQVTDRQIFCCKFCKKQAQRIVTAPCLLISITFGNIKKLREKKYGSFFCGQFTEFRKNNKLFVFRTSAWQQAVRKESSREWYSRTVMFTNGWKQLLIL